MIAALITGVGVILAAVQRTYSYADCAMVQKVIAIESEPSNFKILHAPLIKCDSTNAAILSRILEDQRVIMAIVTYKMPIDEQEAALRALDVQDKIRVRHGRERRE